MKRNDKGQIMAKGRKRMARGRAAEPKAAVSLATMGDMGATGPANQARLRVERIMHLDPETLEMRPDPNGLKRARVVDMLSVWLRNGTLSTAQWNTAVVLRAAWERTEQAPGTDYAKPKVDSSPKPDHAVAIQIDRVSKLNAAWARVKGADRELIHHCVVLGLGPATLRIRGLRPYHGRGHDAGIAALQAALDRAAHN